MTTAPEPVGEVLPVVVPDAPITRRDIAKMTAAEMKKAMSDPVKLMQIDAALREAEEEVADVPEPTQEEIDAAQERQAEADDLAKKIAEAQAAKELETAQELKAAEVEAAKPKKIVQDYQATDEQGNAIGRPTHLEAMSPEEMYEKMKTAHINAVRAFNRVKNQKAKTEEPVRQRMTDEEMLATARGLQDQDPAAQLASIRKLTDEDQREKERLEVQKASEALRQERESWAFMNNHLTDYNRCQANAILLQSYLQENNLEWTADNLEIAFYATESQLAPVTVPVVNPPTAQLTPAPVVAAAPVAPVTPVTPVAVPVDPPAVVNPPAAARPGVNTGIVPGELNGRPVAKPQGLTKAEIRNWTGKEMRVQMKNPIRRAEIERVLAGR